jgi:hypothetical protein
LCKIFVRNGANIAFNRTTAGSGAITINGDVGEDFIVDATSTLTVGGSSYNFDVSVVLNASATAQIFGTVYLSPLSTSVHTRAYITAAAAGSLVFESGAACHLLILQLVLVLMALLLVELFLNQVQVYTTIQAEAQLVVIKLQNLQTFSLVAIYI